MAVWVKTCCEETDNDPVFLSFSVCYHYLTLTVLCNKYYDAYVVGEGKAASGSATFSDLALSNLLLDRHSGPSVISSFELSTQITGILHCEIYKYFLKS